MTSDELEVLRARWLETDADDDFDAYFRALERARVDPKALELVESLSLVDEADPIALAEALEGPLASLAGFSPPSSRELRTKLARLHKTAVDLVSQVESLPAYATYAASWVGDNFDPSRGTRLRRRLEDARRSAERLRRATDAREIGRSAVGPGGHAALARRTALEGIRAVYERATGKPATRITDPYTDEGRGPFRDFVRACLAASGSDLSVDHAIRLVTKR